MLDYVFGRRSQSHSPAVARAFTIHQQSGITMVLGGLAGVGFIEIPILHLVLARWSLTAAWLATAVGFYGTFWLIALCRSYGLRPVLLTPTHLAIRVGLLWRLDVPLDAIQSVRRATAPYPTRRTKSYLAATAGNTPVFMIELTKPLTAEGPYGVRKSVTRIGIAPDEPAAFEAALAASIT